MTDDSIENPAPVAAAPAAKRRPGRPRTRVTPIKRGDIRDTHARQTNLTDLASQMEAKPNWVDMDADYANEAGLGRFHVPQEIIPDGMDLVWMTSEVRGQPSGLRTQFERGGWTAVSHQDFNGRFDGMWGKRGQRGEINVDGLVLAARPLEISSRAKMRERRQAAEPMILKEQQLKGIGVDVTGGDHKSALAHNRVSRSREPTFAAIPVPKDDRD